MNKSKDKINIYTLFANIPVFIYLLPFPILQNFLFNPRSFFEHITSSILSAIVFAAAIIISAADYRTKRYSVHPEYARIKEGIFFRSKFCIPYRRLQSVIIRHSPIPTLFNAVKVQLNTAATKAKKGDAVLYLSRKNAKRLINEIYDDAGYILKHYRAKNIKIFFMAAIWSNPVSGFLILSPLVSNTGKIIGEQLRDELINNFNLSRYLVYIGINPTAAFVTYVLLVCYSVSVLTDFIRTANFTCTAYQNGIVIKRGIIKNTFLFTHPTKINAVTLSQSIFMIPLSLYSAYIHTTGSGKAKGDRSLLLAAQRKNTLKNLLKDLLPNLNFDFHLTLKPVRRSFKTYIIFPLILLTADISLYFALRETYLSKQTLQYYLIFSIPIIAVLFLFRLKAFENSSISLNKQFLYVNFFRRVTLKSTLIPMSKIQLCVKRTSLFQRYSGTCNVRIYIYGEKRTFVEIKYLDSLETDKFIEQLNHSLC